MLDLAAVRVVRERAAGMQMQMQGLVQPEGDGLLQARLLL